LEAKSQIIQQGKDIDTVAFDTGVHFARVAAGLTV
jgi:hypothetical protein